MSHDDAVTSPERLIPRWFTVTSLISLVVAFLGFLGLSFAFDGALGWSFRAGAVAVGLFLVSACSALARPRRRREPLVSAEGVRTFLSPRLTVWPLVGSWLALLVVAGFWAYVAVTDFSAVESPGFTLLTVVGAIGSLPDLARLLTGRLYRWRLDLGPDSFTYRGYRTDLTVPWSKVGRATIQSKAPAGVLINIRGESKDPVVPIAAFAVPAEQLVEEIQHAKASARR